MVKIKATEFYSSLESSSCGIQVIKPRVVFEMVEAAFQSVPVMQVAIPSMGIGSITMLEASVMSSFLNLVNPGKIFEFGTFLGYSTALLARNSGPEAQVISVDLGEQDFDEKETREISEDLWRSDWSKNDDYLRQTQLRSGAKYVAELPESIQARVRLLKGDSRQLDVDKLGLAGELDFIFVDGGHDYETIRSDTRKSLEMIGEDGMIFWHDFNSGLHSEVTDYLTDFASDFAVYHVESTMLAFLARGETINKLKSAGSII